MQPCFTDAIFNGVVLAVEQTTFIEGRSLFQATRLADDL